MNVTSTCDAEEWLRSESAEHTLRRLGLEPTAATASRAAIAEAIGRGEGPEIGAAVAALESEAAAQGLRLVGARAAVLDRAKRAHIERKARWRESIEVHVPLNAGAAHASDDVGAPLVAPLLVLTLGADGRARLHMGGGEGERFRSSWSERNCGIAMEWLQRWGHGARLTADPRKIAALAEQAQPLIERVRAGHSLRGTGSQVVGELTEDAQLARNALATLIANADWTVREGPPEVYLLDWWRGDANERIRDALGIASWSDAVTDAEIEAAAQLAEREGEDAGVVILEARQTIRAMLDEMRDAV